MSEKPIKVPGPDHSITVSPDDRTVTASVDGKVIATSAATLLLAEAGYPPVHYFPREDVDLSALERTDHSSYCPYKGDAAYFSIRTGDGRIDNAVWTYEKPHPAVSTIGGHLAFYTDRVTVSVEPSR
ncbi:DUF427 domain-containing protein [Microlunatus soli]|uniref:Uncharacterized conserved protein, DUF427 family n=1 Tax=Microlunatus soli TaxID=630515 RepID=A0A1H1RUY6_9ACTN|nr:DUF427 domain-containing protein [Microlunatus soli]SDS39455.1 Uncharacterized conserved protein, DUF427 family [Microlunatus soli]